MSKRSHIPAVRGKVKCHDNIITKTGKETGYLPNKKKFRRKKDNVLSGPLTVSTKLIPTARLLQC